MNVHLCIDVFQMGAYRADLDAHLPGDQFRREAGCDEAGDFRFRRRETEPAPQAGRWIDKAFAIGFDHHHHAVASFPIRFSKLDQQATARGMILDDKRLFGFPAIINEFSYYSLKSEIVNS